MYEQTQDTSTIVSFMKDFMPRKKSQIQFSPEKSQIQFSPRKKSQIQFSPESSTKKARRIFNQKYWQEKQNLKPDDYQLRSSCIS